MDKIQNRTQKLFQLLDSTNGSMMLIAKVMDLENQVEELQKEISALKQPIQEIVLSEPYAKGKHKIEIAEFCDHNYKLLSQPSEDTWIQSLRLQTKLDIRAILSPLPTEIGLHSIVVAYISSPEQMKVGSLKFWVVKATDKRLD